VPKPLSEQRQLHYFLAGKSVSSNPRQAAASCLQPPMAGRFRRSRWVDRERRRSRQILAGLHAPSSNFGRAARQSTSVLICLGLALAPWFLRAIRSIPSFGIAKFAAIVLISGCQQKCQQIGRMELTFYECFQRGLKISPKIWNQTNGLSYCFYWCFQLGAPGQRRTSALTH